MEIRLLGPVEVHAGGRLFEIGSRQLRLIVASLAVDAGRPVPTDTLLGRVWDEPADNARRTLSVQLSAVRKVLDAAGAAEPPAARVERRSGGYCLAIDPDAVDLLRWRRLVASAAGPDRLAALRAAIELHRGEPLAGLGGGWAARVRQECLRERLETLIAWAGAETAAGDPRRTIGPLTEAASEYPYVEPVAAALIRAQHAAGRGAEALETYAAARRRLVDELGAEPGPELRAAHRDALAPPPRTPPAPSTPDTAESEATGPDPEPAPTDPPAPNQLPATTRWFTGRDAELDRLLTAPDDPAAPALAAVHGMPGVGKTALTVLAAHRLTGSGRYPDGTLFVDLHGYSGVAPTDPADALDALLRGLGVPGAQIAPDPDARAAQYRSVTAGRRVLIVLDNARDVAQVAALLPGSPSCRVLVTSRRRLAGLDDAMHIDLDTLPTGEAVTLFRAMAGAGHDPGDADTAERIVRLCGLLPLAIRIAATRLTESAGLDGPLLLAELQAAAGAEQVLDLFDDGDRSVLAALDVSYRHLTAEQQEAFTALGLHPGTFEPYAAAALLDTTPAAAGRLLRELERVNLLEQPTRGRYRFHDLVRAYAAGRHRWPADRVATAHHRLRDHYAGMTTRAGDVAFPHLRPPGPDPARPGPDAPTGPPFADRRAALGWLDAELPNLLAVAYQAADLGRPEHLLRQSAALRGYFAHQARPEAETLYGRAAELARTLGDPVAEVAALTSLALGRRLQGRIAAATTALERARELATATGDRTGELDTLIELGRIWLGHGQHAAALGALERARELARAAADPVRETRVLNSMAQVHRLQDDRERATACYGAAIELSRRTGDPIGRTNALVGLGSMHQTAGRHREAAMLLEQALDLARADGNPLVQMNALIGLSRVHNSQGRYAAAVGVLDQALQLARAIGSGTGELGALVGLGQSYRADGRHDAARLHLRRAYESAAAEGDRNWQFEAQLGLAQVEHDTGGYGGAADTFRQALALAASIRQPSDEARAHSGLAASLAELDRRDEARAHWQQALDIMDRLGTDTAGETTARDLRDHIAALDADATTPGRP